MPQYCRILINIFLCQVNCSKEAIQNDDIAKGIIELISLHGITKLVVGAASDKNCSKYGKKYLLLSQISSLVTICSAVEDSSH